MFRPRQCSGTKRLTTFLTFAGLEYRAAHYAAVKAQTKNSGLQFAEGALMNIE
jgi:hypothetical protein